MKGTATTSPHLWGILVLCFLCSTLASCGLGKKSETQALGPESVLRYSCFDEPHPWQITLRGNGEASRWSYEEGELRQFSVDQGLTIDVFESVEEEILSKPTPKAISHSGPPLTDLHISHRGIDVRIGEHSGVPIPDSMRKLFAQLNNNAGL
jgi:hypothetical protein